MRTYLSSNPSARTHCQQVCLCLHRHCWASWAWYRCAHLLTHSTQTSSSSSGAAAAAAADATKKYTEFNLIVQVVKRRANVRHNTWTKLRIHLAYAKNVTDATTATDVQSLAKIKQIKHVLQKIIGPNDKLYKKTNKPVSGRDKLVSFLNASKICKCMHMDKNLHKTLQMHQLQFRIMSNNNYLTHSASCKDLFVVVHLYCKDLLNYTTVWRVAKEIQLTAAIVLAALSTN